MNVLNFPCGKSSMGNVRADIDINVRPDIVCDLYHPPFKPGAFEVVICDPDFKMYSKFKWLLDIKSISSKYFLLCTPQLVYNFKGFRPSFYLSRKNNTIFIRIFILYKKIVRNSSLLDYPKYKKLKNKTSIKTPRCRDLKVVKESIN